MTNQEKQGVVVGKFYPYHLGHKYLISTAAQNCAKLYVLVCKQAEQWIPAAERVKWIEATLPESNIEVRLFDQEEMSLPDEGAELWAEATRKFLGFTPDIVFTSEDYGKPWAEAMGCEHMLIDQKRNTVPISGTMIRSAPDSYVDYLEEPARRFFAQLKQA